MKHSEKKAAQMAAYLIFRADGELDILKLMKLMYLAERESFRRYGEPIAGDTFYSMDHGPILSVTLDHINSFRDSEPDGWEAWIKDREDHRAALRDDDDPTLRLTQLSDADIEVLAEVWKKHGSMTGSQLRNLTHRIRGEWEDPNGSSVVIPHARILRCVGHDDPEVIRELLNRIESQRAVESFLDGLSLTVPWECAAGCTLLIPSGPSGHHLHVILNAPGEFDGYETDQCVLVSVATIHRGPYDVTCVIEPGRHPFVVERSHVAYRHARLDSAVVLARHVDAQSFIPREPVDPDLLDEVRQGLARFRQTPNYIKRLGL